MNQNNNGIAQNIFEIKKIANELLRNIQKKTFNDAVLLEQLEEIEDYILDIRETL